MKNFLTYLIALFSILSFSLVSASALPYSEASFESHSNQLICGSHAEEEKKKKEGEGEGDDEEPECD